MKKKYGLRLAALIGLMLAAFCHGSTNYWDTNGAGLGFGAADGSWGVDANWSVDPLGIESPTVVNTVADDVLYFGTASDGLSSGVITVEGFDQGFKNMIFGAASGVISIEGSLLNLAYPASTIEINNDTNMIGVALSGEGGFVKAGTVHSTTFLTSTPTVMFPGMKLSDVGGVFGFLAGRGITTVYVPQTALALYFVNNGTTATFQMQCLHDSKTKCVGVELTQQAEGIAAHARYAKYTGNNQIGFNFDAGGSDFSVANSYTDGGYGVPELLLYHKTGVYSHCVPAESTVLFPDISLAQVSGAQAFLIGSAITPKYLPAQSYHFVNNGATASVQFQGDDSGSTKCVKVELVQDGSDIKGRVVYAKYASNKTTPLGTNFDNTGSSVNIATNFNLGYYGVAQLRLRMPWNDSVLKLTGKNVYEGKTVLGDGRVEIEDDGVLGEGSYTNTILNSGALVYAGSSDQQLSGAISGPGSLEVKPYTSSTSLTRDSMPGYVLMTPQVAITNAVLADFQSATAFMSGTGLPEKKIGEGYHYHYDGTRATMQFQAYQGGHTKCVKVELIQEGNDIKAVAVYAKYVNGKNVLGFDFDTGGNEANISTSDTTGWYGIKAFKLSTARVVLSGDNSYKGGTIVSRGILETRGSQTALPLNSVITVENGAELRLNSEALLYSAGGVGANSPITVNNGMLCLMGAFNAGHNRPITINGGELNSYILHTDGDSANLINNLTLMNGALVSGQPIRVGAVSTPTLNVTGSTASEITSGITLAKYASDPLTLNVADVTGNPDFDLTISGTIRDFSAVTGGMTLLKAGTGTLVLSAPNTFTGAVVVAQGTLQLADGNALNSANNCELAGGRLEVDAYAHKLGYLKVTGNNVVSLGTGTLSFANSSDQIWSGELMIEGELAERSIRFGTDQTGLTDLQLAMISDSLGKTVRINKDGYLTGNPLGSVMLVR